MRTLLGFAVAAVSVFAMSRALPACEEDTGCTDDYDCSGAFVCKVSSGVCEAFVCKEDADCSDDRTCDDNVCR